MAKFFYKAVRESQDVTNGFIEADSVDEAEAKLTNAGQVPIEIMQCMKVILPYESLKTQFAAVN